MENINFNTMSAGYFPCERNSATLN